MLERERFSAKTLRKILFHFQNELLLLLLLLLLSLLMVRPLRHWDKMDFETLQNWLSGLTRHRLKIGRHHRILHGRDSVVSAVSSRTIFQRNFFFFGNCLISNVLTEKT